jgi:hypothetical protein
VISNDNGVVICAEGTKTCTNGVWSDCKPNAFRALNEARSAMAITPRSGRPSGWMDESSAALEIVSDASRRFSREVVDPDGTRVSVQPLSAGVAEWLEQKVDGVHAVVERPVAHGAEVLLPATADGWTRVTEDASGMSVRFRMPSVTGTQASVAQKLVVYPGAVGGGHAIYRVTPEGVEDFVLLPGRQVAPQLRYQLDVSLVQGLRLVENVLEMVDASGTPRLRVAPPHVFDSSGIARAATLTVSGCAADTKPAAPWGRPITAPGAATCEIRVTWDDSGLSYPVLVDPSWVATGAMVEARYNHRSTPLASSKVLDSGGFDTTLGAPTQICELFDPTTATWAATGPMAQARYLHTATSLLSGKVLVAGGDIGSGALATAEIYDPVAGTFSAVASAMNSAHAAHSATALNSGLVLVAGGYGTTGSATTVAELFDPSTNQFTTTQPLFTARDYHRASLLRGGEVLVTGGLSGGTATASAELFDPTSNSFSTTGSMGTARAYHAVATLPNGNVLVTGGSDGSGNVLSSAEVYSLSAGTFSATGSLTTAREYHSATALPSGQVLVTGGYDGANWLAQTGLYNPTAGTFSAYVSMGTQRGKHTTTMLSNGEVLAAGGQNSGGSTANAEVLTLVPAGSPCTSNSDCASNSCDDGICCSSACGGTCQTCQLGTGACVSVINAPDPDTCSGSNACNGLGQCVQGATVCTNDPCDPTCATFPTYDGSLGGDAALADGGAGSWQGVVFGAGGAVNPGFTDKGIQECGQSARKMIVGPNRVPPVVAPGPGAPALSPLAAPVVPPAPVEHEVPPPGTPPKAHPLQPEVIVSQPKPGELVALRCDPAVASCDASSGVARQDRTIESKTATPFAASCTGSSGNKPCGAGTCCNSNTGSCVATCGSGEECATTGANAGECVCDSNSCSAGCCSATLGGTCNTQGTTACGRGGVTCVNCTSTSNACDTTNGSCTCNANSCPNGCCSAGKCTSSNSACGTGGGACTACVSGQECVGGACKCDANSCPNGCCNGNVCVPYASENGTQCGTGGAACTSCGNTLCDTTNGTCTCDANTCPNGCCNGGTSGSCEAYASQSNSSCGVPGATCTACSAGQECSKSSSGCVCDANSCPNGCCSAGACYGSTQQSSTACGNGGAACVSCASGDACVVGVCQAANGACDAWQYGEFNACQFDTYCVPGACSADGGGTAGMCLQYGQGQTVDNTIPGASCTGVDLTLGVACSDSQGNMEIPVCNRGSTTLAASTVVTFFFGGGTSTGIPGTPQCTDLKTALSPVTCATTVPSGGLAPGQCFDLTGASPAPNGYSSCSSSLKQGNATVFVNPDMSITECNLSPEPSGGYTNGGGCDDNWTDLHKPGGSCSTLGATYQTIVYTQQYTGRCPAGFSVQWGTFTYDTVQQSDASGSTSVLFTAQTASLAADGGAGAFGASHTIADPPNVGWNAPSADPNECDLATSCAVDLYKRLGNLPDALNPVLDLTITLNPTPDKQAAPTVLTWNLTYSCVPTE